MIEPWQVWLADLSPSVGSEQDGLRPVVVVSSPTHLRMQQGRNVLVSPVTSKQRDWQARVPITNPHGEANWVVTEQVRFISTRRFMRTEAWWRLEASEIEQCRRALRLWTDY